MDEELDSLMREVALKLSSNPRYHEEFKGWDLVMQVETLEGGLFYIHVSENGLSIREGGHPSPTLRLRASEDVLKRVLSGRMSEVKAFFTGKIRVYGDLVLAERLYRKVKKLLS